MYTIHTTPGFIIESRPSGETGKVLSIFTRDLGLVRAIAQGIRLEKSKLRYHTQDFSFGMYSFVRGKEYWRLTSADVAAGKAQHELVARIALLLRRLLQGEEAHAELFVCIEEARDFMEKYKGLSAEQSQILESLIVFRILHALGYIGTDRNTDQKLISEKLSVELIETTKGQRMEMNRHINKALKESHL